jgi:hypothetical protein
LIAKWYNALGHAKAKGVEALFIDFSIQDKDSGLNLIIGFKINKQRLDPFGLTPPTPLRSPQAYFRHPRPPSAAFSVEIFLKTSEHPADLLRLTA